MPPLPAHVLACPGSVDLILRALRGELPQGNLYDAWDALPDPDGYKPTEEVRIWLHTNWRNLMPVQSADSKPAPAAAELACAQIPTVPTVQHAPALSEDWMQPFLEEYVKCGGVVIQAAKAGPVHRDTVYEYIKHDPEFARAFLLAEEERKGIIRSTITRRAIDGWDEPVFGRMDRVEGKFVITETVQVGTIRKTDNRLLMQLAASCCEEFAPKADGTSVTIHNNASASANASATVKSGPAKLKNLQARLNKQLERQARRDHPATN